MRLQHGASGNFSPLSNQEDRIMTYGQPPADNQGGTGNQGGTVYQPAPSGGTPPPAGGGYSPPPAGGGYSAPPPSTYTAPPVAAGSGNNTFAIIALVLGIIALLPLCTIVFGWVSILLGLIAAILGFMARSQIKQTGQGGSGMAMAGLVLGIIALILGLLETAGFAALLGFGGTAINQALTSVPLTLTAGATPGP